jgi:hypothetical protein
VGFTCSVCGGWHDQELLDVRAGVPEEVLAIPPGEREGRVVTSPGGDFTSIVDADRHFVRALIELPIDEATHFGLGVWVNLPREDVAEIEGLWDDPGGYGRAFRAELATDLPAYGETVGLPGALTLRETKLLPIFLLDEGTGPLARDQHAGITLERARELAEPYR